MDEILPGLWVGGVRAAMDPDYLSRAGITHIITCMKQNIPPPRPLADGRTITRAEMRHVRIDDEEKAPILVHFAGCNEFIADQLEEEFVPDDDSSSSSAEEEKESDEVELLVQGRQKRSGRWGSWQTTGSGTVLVHCQAGCSRSVAIVSAYLMHTRHISASTAVAMIKARRPDAGPNKGFLAQLELYEQVGWEVDMKFQAVRRFLMSKTDILNGDSMDDMLLSYYPSPYPSPALSASTGGMRGFTAISRSNSSSRGASGTTAAAEDASTNSATNTAEKNQKPPPRSRSASFSSTTSSSSAAGRISLLSSITLSDASPCSSLPTSQQPLAMSSPSASTSTAGEGNTEVKVTANSSGRLPGGVPSIRGHEGANNRGALPKPTFKGPKLRCKGCRRELAALDHVVIHEPGKGQMAFEHRRRDVRHSADNVATTSSADADGETDAAKEGGTVDGEDKKEDAQAQTTSTSNSGEASSAAPAQAASTTAPPAAAAPTRRPMQTAASLNSQLPPHLAALRGNRPPRPPFQPRPAAAADAAQPSPIASSSATSTPLAPSTPASTPANPPTPSAGATTMTSMLKHPSCSSYFLEPMAWMSSLSSGEVTGKLNCPSAKCGAKLGSWDWAGMQCGCGAWVTPAFSLHRSKVDEI